MSITLQGHPHECVNVTGDITTRLRVPVGWADRRFRIAASDGTLILGTYSDGAYHFDVEVEGAGIVRPGAEGLTLEWAVEWVAISDVEDSAVAVHLPEALPLFEAY
ncbi:MAG: hypothetical protein ABW128_09325 [Rhizorhabdus sp.]